MQRRHPRLSCGGTSRRHFSLFESIPSFTKRSSVRVRHLEPSLEHHLALGGCPGDPGLVGRTFGPYQVLSLIQRGGMGEIYLAELAPQGIRVVLKRLQDVHHADDRYVEMFQNEAAMMSELEHPNIVKVLGTPVIEGKQCLVMEFVRGRNLQQVLRKLRELERVLPPGMAIHIAQKVLMGLHEAHQARLPDGRPLELVHRDVKPGNVLISFAGDVKITDFGIAKSAMQNHLTTAGVVKGTVRYLSPEQIRSEKITHLSDVFSCASVLVEVLSDRPLYDRGSVAPTLMAILNDDRPPIAELLSFRAPELVDVLERALDPEPEKRFRSARDFAHALGAASRALGAPANHEQLGALLRQLFQGTPEAALDVRVSTEDVTYLITGDDSGSRSIEVRKARPSSSTESKPRPPPPPLASDPSLPGAYLRAEARARAMLDTTVVFDEPIEIAEKLGDPADQGGRASALEGWTSTDLPSSAASASQAEELLEWIPAAHGSRSMGGAGEAEREGRQGPLPPPLGRLSERSLDSRERLPSVDSERLRRMRTAGETGAYVPSTAGPVQPRLYLLVGCLLGVALTCGVLILAQL